MFAKSIVLSDAFLDMPLSARCLYFTLGMLADDDGFVGSPKAIMRQCGASRDDMLILLQKRYVLEFKSGVIVIKHWRMNNYLQNDRHKSTTYLEELALLKLDDKGAYTEIDKPEPEETDDGMYTKCIQNVYTGKNSIEEVNKVKDNTPPLPPSWDFDKHTNAENYKHLIESDCECSERYKQDFGLAECIGDWMEYKDARKPKADNHYANEKSMMILLKQVCKYCDIYGVPTVISLVEECIGNNYRGIIWNKLTKAKQGKQSTEEYWRSV